MPHHLWGDTVRGFRETGQSDKEKEHSLHSLCYYIIQKKFP